MKMAKNTSSGEIIQESISDGFVVVGSWPSLLAWQVASGLRATSRAE